MAAEQVQDVFVERTVFALTMHGGHGDMEWATITLDDTNGVGRVSIASSYGDWTYNWLRGNRGKGLSIAAFVARCDNGYLTGKFASGDDEDVEQTATCMKVALLERRRKDPDAWDADKAREEWDRIESCGSIEELVRYSEIPDAWEFTVTVPNRAFTHFMETFGKRMRTAMRALDGVK